MGPANEAASGKVRRQARKAMIALSTPRNEVLSGKDKEDEGETNQNAKKKVYTVELPPEMKPLQNFKLGDDNFEEGREGLIKEEEEEEEEGPSTIPVIVMRPKTDFYGLGFDPYKHAPEFAEAHRNVNKSEERSFGRNSNVGKGSLFRPRAGTMAMGFGIGSLEEVGEEDEDIYAQDIPTAMVASDEEDAKMEAGKRANKLLLQSQISEPFQVKRLANQSLPGFKLGSMADDNMKWFPPPVIPRGFVPNHRFSSTVLDSSGKFLSRPIPEEVPPVSDPKIRTAIEGLATFVARGGQKFEDLVREKNVDNPLFSFLFGGPGIEYYNRKLWELREKQQKDQGVAFNSQGGDGREDGGSRKGNRVEKLDSERRGEILGERTLPKEVTDKFQKPGIGMEDKTRLQAELSNQFERGTQQDMNNTTDVRLVKEEPLAKQTRLGELAAIMGSRFTSGGSEGIPIQGGLASVEQLQKQTLVTTTSYPNVPRREEEPWRPAPLLCKRYDILDPFAGKEPPAPKPQSRTESLFLSMSEAPLLQTFPGSLEAPAEISHPTPVKLLELPGVPIKQESLVGGRGGLTEREAEEKTEELILEKPIDLFKAIFSDESSEEEEVNEKKEVTMKKSEGAQQGGRERGVIFNDGKVRASQAAEKALNRLEANDFLEALGSELGLEVPEVRNVDILTVPPVDVLTKAKTAQIETQRGGRELAIESGKSESRKEKMREERESGEREERQSKAERKISSANGDSSQILPGERRQMGNDVDSGKVAEGLGLYREKEAEKEERESDGKEESSSSEESSDEERRQRRRRKKKRREERKGRGRLDKKASLSSEEEESSDEERRRKRQRKKRRREERRTRRDDRERKKEDRGRHSEPKRKEDRHKHRKKAE